MKLGTKSVLFGAHCFVLHPWFVALAWWKIYGFPWDPRLWIAFFVHDLGYVGKPNMDGEEGELHPYWGAFVMGVLFGRRWFEFTLAHSRYLAKRLGISHSKLCVADKLSITLTPAWLYVPMVRATGEVYEYLDRARIRSESNEALNIDERRELTSGDIARWYAGVQAYMCRWVEEHRDLKPDRWTGVQREPDAEGVWQ